MMHVRCSSLILVVGFVACVPSTSSPTATATATATASPTATANAPPMLEGTWESAACGERKYARTITFEKAGAFHADDLVSPCPKGVTCVWSGIVSRSGKYAVAGTTVTLSVEGAPSAGPPVAPFPATLELTPTPVEVVNGLRCGYRQVTAPPSSR